MNSYRAKQESLDFLLEYLLNNWLLIFWIHCTPKMKDIRRADVLNIYIRIDREIWLNIVLKDKKIG